MRTIAQECKDIIKREGINLSSSIEYDVNGVLHTLSMEWIIDAYMQASQETHQVFLDALKLSLEAKGMGIDKFFEDMGQLILMTHLSEKLEV
ncbi:hypothetical protein JHD48_04970 [Sulfurimonas sp. SAG-AH-194-I05]|nr:hypothetical protein [Sulfurimonas sp. SAG-AH-194-I05]MDF1875082.1 hypothetical protein [Sulfurimonas sp. SAG-AH-194-I05]